ncbi:MAG: ATP-binding protein [Myxococcales bacterium]
MGDPLLEEDALLASHPGMAESTPVRRESVTTDTHTRLMVSKVVALLLYAFMAVTCLALWRGGYAGWRIAVLLASLVVPYSLPLALYGWRVWDSPGNLTPAQHDRLEIFSFVMILSVPAVTGGLHSPFFFGALLYPWRPLVRHGWSRTAQIEVGMLLAGVAVLAALPAGWLGPQIPEPLWSGVSAAVILFSAIFFADYLVSMLRDVAAHRREVFRAREALAAQALTRARDLEQFGSQLSHELRNPLGAIKTLVQLSIRSAHDAKERERLEVVSGEVERMHGILQEYLSFSRPVERLQVQPVSLGTLADDVVLVMSGRAETACVALRRRGEIEAIADPRRIKEALINLVANALEASPSGGTIDIDVDRSDGFARVSVRDTGNGMPPDVLARIGTPFFTTREQGVGLGVVLARAAFTQHGGALRYESVQGAGTTATATLPLRPRDGGSDGATTPRR